MVTLTKLTFGAMCMRAAWEDVIEKGEPEARPARHGWELGSGNLENDQRAGDAMQVCKWAGGKTKPENCYCVPNVELRALHQVEFEAQRGGAWELPAQETQLWAPFCWGGGGGESTRWPTQVGLGSLPFVKALRLPERRKSGLGKCMPG